ncbi:MBL fold metallo-hydrolase RNA specificity domain-containing protein [Zeaxanthinibacter enoshimensis]|uniref:Metallo-beta-lactamase family protein n=1 Tax=Zeaxanthinibacter enoshimensis TaxID=392009 RepID=A0A4V3D3Q6_9FLAO|nr:MBL fold metallo-hydrolase [Zeaxanthinibacter enoshimensis]TDQ30903.1 metallo-beta-lactamase family protein [Zeaxanthinibacter enoshimensis]
MTTVKIHFLGASGTVTGSKYLLQTPELSVMVDCGLFQGKKALREMNRKELPVRAGEIDLVLLTHGHLDHTGYLPRLVAQGFRGKIIGTGPSLAIAEIILRDTAKIQEEEAEQANKEGYSRHQPALPLYDLRDVELTLELFQPKQFKEWYPLADGTRARFMPVGHILGAAFIELEIKGKLFVFSGDIGRDSDLLLDPPEKPRWADYLFVESTYGDRLHPVEDIDEILISNAKKTIENRGTLIIPSFAVERFQSLMYRLWKLYDSGRLPNIPIFIDSPMGVNVLSVFERFPGWHNLSAGIIRAMRDRMKFIGSFRETWETIDDPRPKIVIAGSGMLTGGRVLTYLKQLMGLPSTTLLLVGFMAEGTRGRRLLEGEKELKIFGKFYELKAEVVHVESLSAHADQQELLQWLEGVKNIPEKVFLVHGEEEGLEGLSTAIRNEFGWQVHIPVLNEVRELYW